VLREHLRPIDGVQYKLLRVGHLSQLKELNLEDLCRAVLLDMRIDRDDALAAIDLVGSLKKSVALLCLCRNHEQLMRYSDVLHLVDDYLLAESLVPGELSTRVTHAIRRRTKELELLQDQTMLNSLLDNIPDSIYFKDNESQFTKVNTAMATAYGKELHSMLGKTDFDLFTSEHAQAAYDDEQEIIRTGTPLVGKLEKETFEDGTVQWVNTTKLPLRNENGHIIGTMGISRNVTDLQIAQEKLAEEHNLLHTILNNLPDRIFVKDREGRYIATNQHHINFLHAKSEEAVIGTTPFDHFHKDIAERLHEEDLEVYSEGRGIYNQVEKSTDKNGQPCWFLTSKVPLISEQGENVGIVGIARDITNEKAYEEKLRNTIQILNETQLQLIEAEKLKTVGRLAAGVAHEVKNPLGVIQLGVEYLQKQIQEPPELLELMEDMKVATDKANEVIFELLDYSAPHEITMQPVNMNELLHRVLGLMRHNFNKAQIRVRDHSTDEPLFVSMDSSKMEQVLINLFLNAISVMPDGGELTIRSSTQRMQSAGSNVSSELTERFRIGDPMVIVEIEDTGHGIHEDSQDKLFEPFYTTRATGDGTGLGLSVTRSIVEMHRGLITLENCKTHEGACATLYFPTSSQENT